MNWICNLNNQIKNNIMNDKENIRPDEELQESSYSISVSERNYMKEKILRDFPKMKEFMEQEEWWKSLEEMRSRTRTP